MDRGGNPGNHQGDHHAEILEQQRRAPVRACEGQREEGGQIHRPGQGDRGPHGEQAPEVRGADEELAPGEPAGPPGHQCPGVYTGNNGIRPAPTAASAVAAGFFSSSFSSSTASPGLRNRLDSRLYWRGGGGGGEAPPGSSALLPAPRVL